MEGQVTMICMDTSRWMRSNRSARFKNQADAIELYITNILNFHPKNVVGVFGTSLNYMLSVIKPCRDLRRIMDTINSVSIQGDSKLLDAIDYTHLAYLKLIIESTMPIRIAAFAGANLPWYDDYELEYFGSMIKQNNVALDVIVFGKRTKHKTFCLEWVVDAANNNNGNCRIVDVPHGSTVCDALSKFLLQNSLAPLGGLSMQQESAAVKKKDYGENRDPHKKMSPPRVYKTKDWLKSKRDTLTQEIENLKVELLKFRGGENEELTVQPSSTMEAEITVICMDTSMWMGMDLTRRKQKFRLNQQIKLIELYITERLESHPRNVVIVRGSRGELLVPRSRNLKGIMSRIREDVIVEDIYDIRRMIRYACTTIFHNNDMRGRIAMFVGGVVTCFPERGLVGSAKEIKEHRIALDVVNYGDQSNNKWELLEMLAASASYNCNSRILHVPLDHKVSDVLSKFRCPQRNMKQKSNGQKDRLKGIIADLTEEAKKLGRELENFPEGEQSS